MTTPHVFLTRFNLPTTKVEESIYSQAWLADRFELFRTYTVPSVLAQEPAGRHWIIYLDGRSPDWLKGYMQELQAAGVATPNYGGRVQHEFLLSHLRELLGSDTGPLTTSNLDNDDGLAKDFVRRLREAAVPEPNAALYFRTGLIRCGARLYLRVDPENAFCAVRSDLADLRTCWSQWHNRLHTLMPVVGIEGEPGWLQVVHGANVSNRVRGRLVDAAPYRSRFPGLLDDVVAVPVPERIADRVVRQPLRGLRDTVRGTGAKAAVKVVGQGGLEELKYRLLRRGDHHKAARSTE